MKIHRLEISAFGPFAGTEEIDFDRLSTHGLFLLNGPTGAGKTSVLDAICFALYGSVPGARQDGKRLRSDHAGPAVEPRVSCEFSARGRRFEVSRSPAWDRPSARGKQGFTTQQANTLLRERVDGAWIEKSGRNDEAGGEIAAILGMDRDQFTRVVMLPQGDFAAFLRSKASDRLELLQKLFGTQRFEAVEQELSRQALAARAAVASHNEHLALLVARAEGEAAPLGLDTAGAPRREEAGALLEWLEEAVTAHASGLRSAAADAETIRSERVGLLETEAARAGRRLKLAAATSRRAEAKTAAPALELSATLLARHRKAEVLGGQLQAVDAAELARERAAAAMETAAGQLRAAAVTDSELRHVEADTVDVQVELGRLRSLLAVVLERLPDEDRLAGMAVRAAELGTSLGQLVSEGRAHTVTLAALRTESAALLAGIRPLEQLAAEVVLRTKEATAADELVDVVRRYGSAVTACAAITDRHRAAREDHLDSRQGWLDLREERLANAAAELAAQLLEGDPCPVCGSPEHPAPAPAAASALHMAEAEESARERFEAAEESMAAIEQELSAAQQLAAVLAGQGGDTLPDEATLAAVAAHSSAEEAVRAASELAASRSRQAGLDDEIAATEQAQARTTSGIVHTESTLAQVKEQAAELESALSALRAGHPGLRQRISAVRETTEMLQRAEAAHVQLEWTSSQAAEMRDQLDRALPSAGFDSASAARAVLLPHAGAAELAADIRAGQDEQARIEELFAGEDLVLAVQELEAGSTLSDDDLESLRADAANAEQSARDIALAAGLAARSLETLGRIGQDFAEAADAGRQPQERAGLLTALADAAKGTGDNSYRMSLNSYVLAARLEQVAIAASERLAAMSDGRYLLQHTDAKAARGARSGLGLEVVDQWTGQCRDTSTLSGGESFMASLSLALGLADVVQQEAGGVDIETLFVDEGFGSLDEQALEQVMDALEGLRDGGRVVGLVSHVAEMKQRIGTQLQVVKGRTGSTLHISDGVLAG